MRRTEESDYIYPVSQDGTDPSQPLALRKSSDVEARKSLIEKYRDNINATADDGEYQYNDNAGKNNNSMAILEEQINSRKQKKWKYGIIGGVIFLVILVIVLIIVLHGESHKPHP